MLPPPRPKIDFEKVQVDEWLPASIQDVEYDREHERTYNNETSKVFCVRLKFAIDGCKFPHYSRWMKFSYFKKAPLYDKYVKSLVENAQPDMSFDLDILRGMRIKIMWQNDENPDYQSVVAVRPLETKVKADTTPEPPDSPSDETSSGASDEDIPF